MNNKGFFASICSFLGSLFSSDSAQSSNASPSSDGGDLTSVERYIRNQSATNTSSSITSVEAYIRNNKDNAVSLTSVEQYIRDNS